MTRPLVIKLGGLAVENPAAAGPLLDTLAAMHRRDASGLILVHGGGKAVDEHLARLGIVSERREGLRVTGDREINEVVAVLAGSVNTRIVGAFVARGLAAAGLTLGDGLTTRAARFDAAKLDLGHVGEVIGGDPAFLHVLLQAHVMPVVAPIAFDDSGSPLNINADDAAAAVAKLVGARALLLLTDVPGVLDAQRSLIPALDSSAAEKLIASGVISGGMIPKVRASLDAARRANLPTYIASWSDPASLDAVARGEGGGTRFDPGPLPGSVARNPEPAPTMNPSSHLTHRGIA